MLASKKSFRRVGNSVAAGERQSISGCGQARSLSLSVAVAAALCSAPLAVWAAGLGPLTVRSGLGQTLSAEVAITALGNTDPASLSVGLASPEAFRRAGLDFNPALSSLRFSIEPRGDGGALVRVTSTQPVNEPFMDLMLELSWDSGRFVREYTFLLDPPELRLGQDTVVPGGTGQAIALAAAVPPPADTASGQASPAPSSTGSGSLAAADSVAERGSAPASPMAPATATVVSPAPVAQPVQERPASQPGPSTPPVATPRAETSAMAAATAAPAAARSSAERPDTVRVEAGDTASSIAARFKPADVTLEQAVMALYQANPDAFFGSVHQLFSGKSLSIPTDEAIRAVDPVEARREIRTQVAAFDAWRARLAASVPTVDAVAAGQSAAGAVSAPAQESVAAADTGDRLELSRPDATGSGAVTATGEAAASDAAASEESRLAQEAALQEQQERVALLERNVADLQQLLQLKNRQLAELQQQVEAADAAGASGTAASGTIDVDAAQSAPAEQEGSSAAVASDAPAAEAASASASAPVSPTAAEKDSAAAGGEASTPLPTGAGAAVQPESTSGQAAPVRAVDPGSTDRSGAAGRSGSGTEKPADAAGWLDRLTGHPWAWPALLVIAVGAVLLGFLARRRRRQAEFEDSFADVDAFATNSLFAATGGHTIDTHASVFAPGSGAQVATGLITEVDPVAEADVYIAYGREAQAEEILREALHAQPERQAIRLKLLEMHAARRDVEAFATLAAEMHEQTGGANEEWPRVVALGREIDPDNPLYAYPRDFDPSATTTPDLPSDTGSDALAGSFDDDTPGDTPGGSAAGVTTIEAPVAESEAAEYPSSAATGIAGRAVSAAMAADAMVAPQGLSEETLTDEETRALDFDFDLGPEPETTVGRIGLQKTTYGVSTEQDTGLEPGTAGSALEKAIGGAFDLPTLDLAEDAGTVPMAEMDAGIDGHQEPGDEEPVQARASRAQIDDALDFDIDLPTFGDLDVRDSRTERPAVDLAELGDEPEATGETDVFGLQTVEFDLAGVGDEIAGVGSADGSSAAPRWQEMDTKLDLAAAYEEIGDREGARELLQEVLEGGDASQQDKARSMLATIG